MNREMIINDRTTTWSAIGKDVSECRDVDQVLASSGLNYTVLKRPAYMPGPRGRRVVDPAHFYTQRKDYSKTYGIVTDQYEVIQNRDAFDFVSYIGDDFRFLKAGETEAGMVYIIGALPDMDILGDTFTPHVIFSNGFSGYSIKAAICPLRIICQNQFSIAFKEAENAIRLKHTKYVKERMLEAKEVMKKTAEYMDHLNRMAEGYAKMQISPRQIDMVVNAMFPVPDSGDEKKIARAQNARSRFAASFTEAYNRDDNSLFKGTAWGVINAYADLTTREPVTKRGSAESRFEKVTIGSGALRFADFTNIVKNAASA